jgi:hypothetical protein
MGFDRIAVLPPLNIERKSRGFCIYTIEFKLTNPGLSTLSLPDTHRARWVSGRQTRVQSTAGQKPGIFLVLDPAREGGAAENELRLHNRAATPVSVSINYR